MFRMKQRIAFRRVKMKQLFVIAGMMLALCASAYAADKNIKEMGVYIGGTAGITYYDDKGVFDDANLDDNSWAGQVIAGYKFNKYFALDARYVDLGSYSDSVSKAKLQAWSGNVVGSYPFSNSGWEIFGQLGYGQAKASTNCCGSKERDTQTGGLGVRWSLNRHLSFSGQVDTWRFKVNPIDGGKTSNYISALSGGIQYVFE